MQTLTHSRYTLIRCEGNTFEQIDLDDVAQGGVLNDESIARSTAKMLTAEDKATAANAARRYIAVRTLESIGRNTQATELTATDVRWLAGEVVDRCDFFIAAPEWAKAAIDSVADRRSFTPKYVGHVLAAIRCCLSVERQMSKQVERYEAEQGNRGRRF